MSNWHYKQGQDIKGPLSDEQLKALCEAGVLHAASEVWKPDYSAWKPIAETEFPFKESLSPPPVQQTGNSMGGNTNPTFNYNGKASHYRSNNSFLNLEVSHGFVLLFSIVMGVYALFDFGVSWVGIAGSASDAGQAFGILKGERMPPYVVIGLLASLGYIIASCFWVYRATANLFYFQIESLKITPGWAVGWWFVPIAFLWMPFVVMSQLRRATLHGGRWIMQAAGGKLIVWWILTVSSGVIALLVGIGAEGVRTTDEMRGILFFNSLTNVLSLIGLILWVVIVGEISRRQANQNISRQSDMAQ